jgi:hypothetical protein
MESSGSRPFRTLTSEEFQKLSDAERMVYLQASMADLQRRMLVTQQLIEELSNKTKR